ncbi:hypothetical protein KC332_g16048 [Hortaea werneckii]|nr:hypothetical protein KC358_g16185 [Hortaea werneckii]KAI6808834.1 hypothetical protein KC350_g13169 [Hortaea werneckii]KAI6902127.1 hypothetical protein KC348_g16212 [Hortaea werneckii]KAI6921406.1 hypothetical protein KC341_g15946 [Hortaea werneckii]KAI6955800.1 hypothetical protein KC321_g15547 [Hortaea werneckii]
MTEQASKKRPRPSPAYESESPAGVSRANTKSWQNFSNEEPVKYNKAAGLSNDVRDAPQTGSQVKSKKVKNDSLIELEDDVESGALVDELAGMKMGDGAGNKMLLQADVAQGFDKQGESKAVESLLD